MFFIYVIKVFDCTKTLYGKQTKTKNTNKRQNHKTKQNLKTHKKEHKTNLPKYIFQNIFVFHRIKSFKSGMT